MNTLKLQQDIMRALDKGHRAVCVTDTENNTVWVTPAKGEYALYCIPRQAFYLDTGKLRVNDNMLRYLVETPKNWARPTQTYRLTQNRKTLVKFETENGKPAYFNLDRLKPFENIYEEKYRIDDKGIVLHVIDGNEETFAIVLAVKVKEEAAI